MMIEMGHPAEMLPDNGISMVHVCVGWPGWQERAAHGDYSLVEDPSKILGMGGNFTNGV